jgi:hypothetical protein
LYIAKSRSPLKRGIDGMFVNLYDGESVGSADRLRFSKQPSSPLRGSSIRLHLRSLFPAQTLMLTLSSYSCAEAASDQFRPGRDRGGFVNGIPGFNHFYHLH